MAHSTKISSNETSPVKDFLEFQRSRQGQDLFIILGSQGSGTNLLCRILEQTFKFSIVQDRSLILKAALRVNKNPSPSNIKKELEQIHKLLFPGNVQKRFILKHYYHQANNYLGIEKYIHNFEIRDAKEFIDFFYDYHAYIVGGNYKAIKSDDISDYFNDLTDDIFPRKKYIFLLRDPRDNALSIMNKNFGPCNIYCASMFVKEKLHLHEKELERHPDSTIMTHYETLLANPKGFIIDFSDKFNIPPIGDLSKLSIRQENLNKWERLPGDDLEICETVLKDEIQRFGYTLKTKGNYKFSSTECLSWRLNDLSKRILQRATATFQNITKP